ncbi:hypothetical protein CO701_15505 [Citrobacter werkmanii]|nr:hypothetical protein CO701_15505 [Citrobacter werkmanii]
MQISPDVEHLPACREIIHATGKRRKHCNEDGGVERKYKTLPVILQAAEALPALAHPSHIVIYAPGDLLVCRLSATRII